MTDCRLPFTESVMADLPPTDWLHVAEFLTGLLSRKPIASGENEVSGWRAEKWILGALATELRIAAHEAGETTFVPRTFGEDPTERAVALAAERAEARGWRHYTDE